jgi:hypothetical protein
MGSAIVWLDGRDQTRIERRVPGRHEGARTQLRRQRRRTARRRRQRGVHASVCQTAAAVTSDGPIVAFGAEAPMRCATSIRRGSWTAVGRLQRCSIRTAWKISGCPINGPAISASGPTSRPPGSRAKGSGPIVRGVLDRRRTVVWALDRIDDVGSLGRVDVQLLSADAAAVDVGRIRRSAGTVKVRRVDATGGRSEPATIAGYRGRIARAAFRTWRIRRQGTRVRVDRRISDDALRCPDRDRRRFHDSNAGSERDQAARSSSCTAGSVWRSACPSCSGFPAAS